MGRLIEEQAVIDCLTNTAKYYEREDADEWTRGMRYGLLHGVDNILDDVKPVEAIPKADYENRLKADLKAILVELQLKIEELDVSDVVPEYQDGAEETKEYIANMIEEKINSLEEA